MTGSFEKIDYRLRPAKHAERLMLVELVRRMRFEHIDQYRYIGMGSIGFVDHRVFHRGLGISDMISIEAASDESVQERFIKNVPLACIDLKFGHTSQILPKLNFDKKCVFWLDYDDRLSSSMSADIATIGSRLPSGSFLAVTFACGIPPDPKGASAEMERLREEFPTLVSEGARKSEFEGKLYADLGKRALGNSLERSLIEMDATLSFDDQRVSSQVFIFVIEMARQCARWVGSFINGARREFLWIVPSISSHIIGMLIMILLLKFRNLRRLRYRNWKGLFQRETCPISLGSKKRIGPHSNRFTDTFRALVYLSPCNVRRYFACLNRLHCLPCIFVPSSPAGGALGVSRGGADECP